MEKEFPFFSKKATCLAVATRHYRARNRDSAFARLAISQQIASEVHSQNEARFNQQGIRERLLACQ